MNKSELRSTIKKWQSILGLDNWEIITSSTKSEKKAKGAFVIDITTTCYPDYCLAKIKSERPKLVTEPDVVHELVHILISELANYAYPQSREKRKRFNYFEERVVSQLTRIILRLYK